MIAVLVAQFLSALADNMLLFIILGLIKQQAVPDWSIPLLQQSFLLAYIVFAPFVGAIADSYPKNKVMLFANSLKFMAVLYVLVGGNAFVAYGLAGIGACVYSPAKYGILKEIKGQSFLVKANALMEGSTIVAILMGVVLGGYLADVAVENDSFGYIFAIVAGIYLLATLSNLLIPKLKPECDKPIQARILLKQFFSDFKVLWADFSARVAVMGTSLFFGVGATLRIWLIAWVPAALHIDDNETPALLSAMVAVGIVIGSGLAARITLSQAYRVLSAGIGMGLGTLALSLMDNLYLAYGCLIFIGICGGLFLVPLNALLQNRGHALIGGGHAVAIQNFVENSVMLLMLCLYLGLMKIGFSAVSVGFAFGALVMLLMLALRVYARGRG